MHTVFIIIVSVVCLVMLCFIVAYMFSVRPAPPVKPMPPATGFNYSLPQDWRGTPVDRKKRYVNSDFPFYQNYVDVLKWLPSHVANLLRNRNKRFPVLFHTGGQFLQQQNVLIWLGHASFYLNLDGVRILIDPHFYRTFIYIRHTPPPVAPKYFTDIHYILLSHDHEDHCDKRSLQLLFRQNPNVQILTGMRMDTLLQSFWPKPLNILTADWYRRFPIDGSLEIYFVPSRHYCKRFLKKFNGYLWGGFIIRRSGEKALAKTIYFGGDSGKSKHFEEVGKVFAPDLALIGIGAYKPSWMMHCNHQSPADAITAFDDCGAGIMIPMHYSTFNLSNENMEAPLEELKRHAGKRPIMILTPGEILPL